MQPTVFFFVSRESAEGTRQTPACTLKQSLEPFVCPKALAAVSVFLPHLVLVVPPSRPTTKLWGGRGGGEIQIDAQI